LTKKIKTKAFKKASLLKGKFVGNERGFGFVIPEEGEDVFIPASYSRGALHGDEVAFKIVSRKLKDDGHQ